MKSRFFPYPGNKSRIADWIIDRFPDHDCYVEAFGGAGGVLYHKPRSKIEVYNDISGEVWNFFDVFARKPDELVARLEKVYYAKNQLEKWNNHIPDDPVDRAARFFFMRYAVFGSDLKGGGFRRMKHRDTAGAFERAVSDLPDRADRLRGVTIDNLDWAEVVDRYDGPDTLFYFDPPYVGPGDGLYEHDGKFDHGRFVDRLSDIEGYWIVSYEDIPDPAPEYEHMAENGTKNAVRNGQDDTERVERLLLNYDPDETPTFAAAEQASVADFA